MLITSNRTAPMPSMMNRRRKGAAAILIVSMMMVFVAVAAVTVDYAYMQLVRSDLRIATDAAAKAGAEALASYVRMNHRPSMQQFPMRLRTLLPVNPFSITNKDVVLGRVTSPTLANGASKLERSHTIRFKSIRRLKLRCSLVKQWIELFRT